MATKIKEKTKDEKQVQTISAQYYRAADDTRKPIENEWDKYWRLYRNQYDFSKKSGWQSQSYLSKLPTAILMGKSIMSKSIRRNPDFFSIETDILNLQQYCLPLKQLINAWLDENKFRQCQYPDSLTAGLLCNLLIFKVYAKLETNKNSKIATGNPAYDTKVDIPKEKKEKSEEQILIDSILNPGQGQQGTDTYLPRAEDKMCIEISAIDPYNFRIDGSGRYRYIIQDIEYDLGEFKANSKKMGYNQNVIDEIEGSYSKQDEYKKNTRYAQGTETGSDSNKVVLREYWGDLYANDGTLIDTNMTWTMANDIYLVREPVKNPFWHGKFPFVWGAARRVPFSVYHKSYCEDIYGLAKSLTDLFNMLIDTNAYAMAKAFELDIDMVYDPEQLKTGVYPGKTFFKRSGGNPNTRMLQDVSLGTINPQALRIYQVMDSEFINGAGLGTGSGTTSSKSRPTAREVDERASISSVIMEDMAMDVEEFTIAPVLDMTYKTALQYQTDFNDERMSSLSAEVKRDLQAFAYLPKDIKKGYINAFKFKSEIISGSIRRQREMQKMLQIFALGAQAGEVGQKMLKRVKPESAMKLLFDGVELDTEKLLYSDEEYKVIEQQEQAMAQQVEQRTLAMKEKESELKGHSEQSKLQADLMKKESDIQADRAKKGQDLEYGEQKNQQNLKFSAQKHLQDMIIKGNQAKQGGKENGR